MIPIRPRKRTQLRKKQQKTLKKNANTYNHTSWGSQKENGSRYPFIIVHPRKITCTNQGLTYQDGDTHRPSYEGPEDPGVVMGEPAERVLHRHPRHHPAHHQDERQTWRGGAKGEEMWYQQGRESKQRVRVNVNAWKRRKKSEGMDIMFGVYAFGRREIQKDWPPPHTNTYTGMTFFLHFVSSSENLLGKRLA